MSEHRQDFVLKALLEMRKQNNLKLRRLQERKRKLLADLPEATRNSLNDIFREQTETVKLIQQTEAMIVAYRGEKERSNEA